MKKNILTALAITMLIVGGCKKDFLSLETNPNAPSVSTPAFTLAAALNNAAAIINTDYTQYGEWGGYWCPSGNYTPSTAIIDYQFTSGSFQADWTNWYADLTNFNSLEVTAAKNPTLANYQAIAMIMKAYGFEALVDNYNDVPYSQAFQPSTILFPAYDKGIDIYHDLGKQLDAAILLINENLGTSSVVVPGTDDIVFNGNMKNWKKFANTIKLRLAVRVSTKFPADALVADLASTSAEGYLDGTTQAAANPGYSAVNGKQSPFYGNYGFDANNNETGNHSAIRANAYCVGVLTAFNDPRISRLYDLTSVYDPNVQIAPPPTIVHGNVFGDTRNNLSNTYTSAFGPGLLISSAQSAVLFSGAESLFLQAEAVQNGLIKAAGNVAQSLYESAITASFIQLGLTSAKAATYYSQSINNVGWTASNNKEQAIIIQKWISLNGYANLEAYNEYRRTGYPNLPNSVDPGVISPTLPTRIYYPLTELSSNPDNLKAELNTISGGFSPFKSKIFWAQ